MAIINSVAIIGGGFSGTLQAVNLLRHEGPRAILIERRPEIGKGIAYSAAHPHHLLNVRASNMSAFPDDPAHFLRWLELRGMHDAGAFIPRVVYGEYLSDLLEQARQTSPGRLQVIQGDAIRVDQAVDLTVSLRDGRPVQADAAVIALGNLPPFPPGRLDPAAMGERYVANPWQGNLADGLADDDHIMIIGTGLTMVDTVLLLDAQGFKGNITALSRRGLLPRRHDVLAGHHAASRERPAGALTQMLQQVRERSAVAGWHTAIDELRPHTKDVWLAAPEEQRLRFLRHLRPWWDVHRHRLAPAVADRIDTLRGDGRLQIVAGRTTLFEPADDKIRVTWQPRGEATSVQSLVRRVINCTGPHADLSRSSEPLLVDLVQRGVIVADDLGLGIAVNHQAKIIGADGAVNNRLFALGPMTRGTFWEITAVPDIRHQTWTLARRLSNAHWVGGEGL